MIVGRRTNPSILRSTLHFMFDYRYFSTRISTMRKMTFQQQSEKNWRMRWVWEVESDMRSDGFDCVVFFVDLRMLSIYIPLIFHCCIYCEYWARRGKCWNGREADQPEAFVLVFVGGKRGDRLGYSGMYVCMYLLHARNFRRRYNSYLYRRGRGENNGGKIN